MKSIAVDKSKFGKCWKSFIFFKKKNQIHLGDSSRSNELTVSLVSVCIKTILFRPGPGPGSGPGPGPGPEVGPGVGGAHLPLSFGKLISSVEVQR